MLYLSSSLREQDGVLQNHLVSITVSYFSWFAANHATSEALRVAVSLTPKRHDDKEGVADECALIKIPAQFKITILTKMDWVKNLLQYTVWFKIY